MGMSGKVTVTFGLMVVLFIVLLVITTMPLWLLRNTYHTHKTQMESNHQSKLDSLNNSYISLCVFSALFTCIAILAIAIAVYDMSHYHGQSTGMLLTIMIYVLFANLLFFMLPLYIWFRYSINENQTSNIQHASTTTI